MSSGSSPPQQGASGLGEQALARSDGRDAVVAYVGLGANLGDARATIDAALQALATMPRTRRIGVSHLYRSAPVDAVGPDFINVAAVVQTELTAPALLRALQVIEQEHGRQRPYRNAPRTLDLDLLLYGDAVIDSAALTVPHPRLHQRAFVLRPLLDLAPQLLVPGRGRAAELLAGVGEQRLDKLDR